MAGIERYNLKVVIYDSDYYALNALNSYFAWDRRTRVTYMAETLADMWAYLDDVAMAELPDVVVIDADHMGDDAMLHTTITQLHTRIPDVMVFCLVQSVNLQRIEVAVDAGARAVMLKQDVRLQITWAIIYALEHDLTVTRTIAHDARYSQYPRLYDAAILPEQRDYPEMTDRVRQAIKLCVIEGMPAHLAADEMGISLHTIRGYIKEGYRILETYDNYEYPTDMTPQERAFMRFTALADDGKTGV